MGRRRLFVRNPPLCVLPCQREEHGAMSRGRGKSVRSCDGARPGASQNNHHYWRSGDVRWRYPSSLMPAVRGTWQVTGAYQGEPSPGTDGGGGRGTRPAQPRRRRPRRNRPPPPGRSQARARPCACLHLYSNNHYSVLEGEPPGEALLFGKRFGHALAEAGRGRARAARSRCGRSPVLGANAAAEAVLASFRARARDRKRPRPTRGNRPRERTPSVAARTSATVSPAHVCQASSNHP